MPSGRFRAAALWGLLLLPAPVGAQPVAQPSAWKLSLGAQGAFESNPLLAAGEATSDESTRLRAALERVIGGRRASLVLAAEGTSLIHRELRDLDNLNWSASLRGTYAPAQKVSLKADASARSDLTREIDTLTDAGVVLPQVLTRSYLGSLGASWRLSPRLTATLDGRYDRVDFESETYVGGSNLGARPALLLALPGGNRISFGYEYKRQARGTVGVDGLVQAGISHGASVVWTGSLGHGVGASATAGALRLDSSGRSETQPTGGLNLTLKRGRHNLSAGYARSVALAYGYGRVSLTDSFLAGETYALGRRTGLAVNGMYGRYQDPSDTGFEVEAIGSSVVLSRTLSRRLRGDVSYRLSRAGGASRPTRSDHVVAMQIVYQRTFR